MTGENHDWVSDMLSAEVDVAMPEWVSERIETALAAEVARRATTDAADEAKRSYLEMQTRSALGTFGGNAPAHYDPSGVGISVHHPGANQPH
ncbi:hypothetical protein [Aestuariimicrobium sp. Y1814]|uniref:hypothetical protein n=1 Tax=Aestuariimicrobium sp. Y1814 TaxID=3418742 RepID=UPI003DA723A1